MRILIISLILFSLEISSATAAQKAPLNAVIEIENLAKKNLDEKKDFEEVKKAINTLLILDDEDPSRTAVLILSQSYNKNRALYDRAINSVETKANKKQLGEIKKILAQHFKNGNG